VTGSLWNPDGTPAYVASSATSAEAAQKAQPASAKQRARVLSLLTSLGAHGATDEEMQDALGMEGSTQRPRRVELCNAMKVRDSGRTRKTRSGRAATVWEAT